MRAPTRVAMAAAATTLALFAAACGGGGTQTPEPGNSGATGGTGGDISINGCNPEEPLIPGNTAEVCGGDFLDFTTAKLIHYNVDTSAPEMDIAESIESDDNQLFTVKLKQGYLFHDGTEVKAKNFVDAWNYTAYGPNGYAGSGFFSAFQGFADVQCGTDSAGEVDCAGSPPKAETLSGLTVVDDYTFTISTAAKVSNLTVRLGYSAFAPMPDSFFADPEAYAEKPVAAGPFKFESRSSTELKATRFADYKGPNVPNVDSIVYRIYTSQGTAYNDLLAGNLDILNSIPSDQLIDNLYQTDLPDRNARRAGGTIRWFTFSPDDEQLRDNVDLRKSMSMAIDRQAIADQVLGGSDAPSKGWVSPVVDGAVEDACGEACVFDPVKAKALYEKAGGYQGRMTYTTNTAEAAQNGQIGEAICNQLKNNLGMDCQLNNTNDFATFNGGLDAREYKGIWRSGWQMDYPSIENFLAPVYAKGADSNKSRYDNPEFDRLLTEAAAADSTEAANTLYQQAEQLVANDFPTAPLLVSQDTIGWSERMDTVKINPFGVPDLFTAKLK